jgi:hypothetical protein
MHVKSRNEVESSMYAPFYNWNCYIYIVKSNYYDFPTFFHLVITLKKCECQSCLYIRQTYLYSLPLLLHLLHYPLIRSLSISSGLLPPFPSQSGTSHQYAFSWNYKWVSWPLQWNFGYHTLFPNYPI